MPSKNFRKAVIALLLALMLGQGNAVAYAATVGDDLTTPRAAVPKPATGTGGTTDVREVFQLNEEIKAKQKRLTELRARIDRYRQSISDAQSKAKTLQGQLAIVEDRIEKKVLAIEAVTTEREQLELEISATRLDLSIVSDRIERQRRLLAALLTELDRAERQPALGIVLANASFGEYFAHRNRLALLQGDLQRFLAELRTDREALRTSEQTLADRSSELQALATKLADERTALREEQDAKARLLSTTRQSEATYQRLLTELKAEQAAIDTDIVSLDAKVRERLSAIDADFGKLGRVAFSWPVPNRGITAYFHDPEYPFRNVFEHPAIDIRAAQGTAIAAAAPGYVARAKDAGYGYSYIMLVHPGGFATVYGHVSQINVQEDTYVTRGQIIGLTGGRPGTRGAGRLTTGAHLHLEVRLNGIPVNPLNYLL